MTSKRNYVNTILARKENWIKHRHPQTYLRIKVETKVRHLSLAHIIINKIRLFRFRMVLRKLTSCKNQRKRNEEKITQGAR